MKVRARSQLRSPVATIIEFLDNPSAGIFSFHRQLASTANGEIDVSRPTNLRRIFAKKPIIISFPSISITSSWFCGVLALRWLAGMRTLLIVHEYASQSMAGKILLRCLLVIAYKVVVVSPGVRDDISQFVDVRRFFLALQGSNFEGISAPCGAECAESFICNGELQEKKYFLFLGSLANFDLESVQVVASQIRLESEFEVIFLGSKASESERHRVGLHCKQMTFYDDVSPETYVCIVRNATCVLLPFKDGASARRSSLILPLTLGVPVVTSAPVSAGEAIFFDGVNIPGYTYSNFDGDFLAEALTFSSPLSFDRVASSRRSKNVFSYQKFVGELLQNVML